MLENVEIVLDDLNKRLSLRSPQFESLKRLAKAIEATGLKKAASKEELDAQLAAVSAAFPAAQFPEVQFPNAADFHWDFLSFCFALATGVGKTRLMGAIIAYLYRTKGLRNFVVIAPGKTVYEKLIADFTEGTPKYVFKGLSCFATKKPIVVSGDTYQNAAGILEGRDLLGYSVVINVFNIQKLNERVTGKKTDDAELKNVARIRRVNENLGQSYFDYLKSRDDLVVLMDEAHHYRAQEAAKTVNEMQPVLGIEMTATPRVNGRLFDDILLEYGLAKAMRDGFVKEPAVVRRQNFRSDDYVNRQEDLDHQKLQDAMLVHESTKTALAEYAFRKGVQKVKPFVLVVAPQQTYADEVEDYIRSAAFYGGKYADKVIKVYSNMRQGANNDAAIAQLLDIERPGNTVEIVIHVNMLSEGWDVTNLYTIVPLRAANSANLVEQTIGRGLRLPYGKRTGVPEIDTLSIVSHDKFDEIIAAAQNMQIEMRQRDVPSQARKTVVVAPKAVAPAAPVEALAAVGGATPSSVTAQPATTVAETALQVIGKMVSEDTSPNGVDLLDSDVRSRIESEVAQTLGQGGTAATADSVATGVHAAIVQIHASMIDIPRVTIAPGDTTMRIPDFSLDPSGLQAPLRDDRLVYDYITDRRRRDVAGQLRQGDVGDAEVRQYAQDLVAGLAESNDIDYDANRQLIGKLATECMTYLRGKLPPADLANCMRNNKGTLTAFLHQQIMEHAVYESDADEVSVLPGYLRLKANTLTIDPDETPRPFNVAIPDGEKSKIRNMVFAGFSKCLFSLQKFDSDPERAFSELLEREAAVLKWFKPTLSNLRLFYGPNEYTPDFVFETDAEKWLCEVKAVGKVDDAVVQAKKNAALKWCHWASDSAQPREKRWRYMLVPDVAINSSLEFTEAVRVYGC